MPTPASPTPPPAHDTLTVDQHEAERLTGLSYKTLERLCAAVADRLIDRFGAESVRVKATKPEPPIPLPVDEVSVEVWKEV